MIKVAKIINAGFIIFSLLFFLFGGCKKGNAPPEAAFSIVPNTGTTHTSFQFDASSSSDEEDPVSSLKVRWDWQNDGLWDTDWSTNKSISHIFAEQGKHYITMEVMDSDGLTAAKTKSIDIMNSPIADFIAFIRSGEVPFTVKFKDLSSNTPGEWSWDFGDGESSTEQDPTHTYNTIGSFTVKLTVSNVYGQDSVSKPQYITAGNIYTNGMPCPEAPTVSWKGMTYNTVLIQSQCWMKENLSWDTGINRCYDDDPANCEKYGRLYKWSTIMNGSSPSNSVPSGVQGICPDGWHVPSPKEWSLLDGGVDSKYGINSGEWDDYSPSPDTLWRGFDAGKNIKSAIEWDSLGNGTDKYGFTALPSGFGYEGTSNDYFFNKGLESVFWSSKIEYSYPSYGFIRRFTYEEDRSCRLRLTGNFNRYFFSLRCLKD